jgi:hypothetical protein
MAGEKQGLAEISVNVETFGTAKIIRQTKSATENFRGAFRYPRAHFLRLHESLHKVKVVKSPIWGERPCPKWFE